MRVVWITSQEYYVKKNTIRIAMGQFESDKPRYLLLLYTNHNAK
jgi:hypothetical protein